MGRIRPFFRIFGGKWLFAPKYPPPMYDIIIEPFAGGAGYSHLYYQKKVILLDSYQAITETWRYLISASSDDILALPDLREGETIHDLDLPYGAKCLIGWWNGSAVTSPRPTLTKWNRCVNYKGNGWNSYRRGIIAEQLHTIKHWEILDGSYSDIQNTCATWFIDPPYNNSAGLNYIKKFYDYSELGKWCKSRKGQAIVCENAGATWLPFIEFGDIKGSRKRSKEVIFELYND